MMTLACSADISPTRCASAAIGNIGSSGCPVIARRGPRSRARPTRTRASRGDSRNRSTSRSTVPVRPYSPAVPTLADLGQQLLIDRLDPAPLSLQFGYRSGDLRAQQAAEISLEQRVDAGPDEPDRLRDATAQHANILERRYDNYPLMWVTASDVIEVHDPRHRETQSTRSPIAGRRERVARDCAGRPVLATPRRPDP